MNPFCQHDLDEALIVARGTYDLYENLKLSSDDLKTIRDIAYDYLEACEEYVSVKVLFSELFQGSTEKFGADFDYYMLLGWTCHAFVPPPVLVLATFRSKATGLFHPNAECLRRGL